MRVKLGDLLERPLPDHRSLQLGNDWFGRFGRFGQEDIQHVHVRRHLSKSLQLRQPLVFQLRLQLQLRELARRSL